MAGYRNRTVVLSFARISYSKCPCLWHSPWCYCARRSTSSFFCENSIWPRDCWRIDSTNPDCSPRSVRDSGQPAAKYPNRLPATWSTATSAVVSFARASVRSSCHCPFDSRSFSLSRCSHSCNRFGDSCNCSRSCSQTTTAD